MAEIVNLNRIRKRRRRDSAGKTADENRARFGRTKAERAKDRTEAEKSAKELDGKRLD